MYGGKLTFTTRDFYKQWWFWGIIAVVVILIIVFACKNAEKFKGGNNLGLSNKTDLMEKLRKICMKHGPFKFLSMKGCGWCGKMREELREPLAEGLFEEIEVDTPQGKVLAEEYKVNGFPYLFHEKLKWKNPGFSPLEEIINGVTRLFL